MSESAGAGGHQNRRADARAGPDRVEEQRADAPAGPDRGDGQRADARAAGPDRTGGPDRTAGPDRTLRLVALVLVGLAIVGVVYNLVTTLRTLDRYPGARFWEVLLATSGDDALSTVWFTAIVWAPAVLGALAAALLLLSFLPALRGRGAARR